MAIFMVQNSGFSGTIGSSAANSRQLAINHFQLPYLILKLLIAPAFKPGYANYGSLSFSHYSFG
jgi:hypothetical protein